jgi:phospholipid/cholesterol/gamma-HCH transport system substrate-binding protein
MKVKFNMFERVAGIFVLVAIVGGVMFTGVTAIQKGWFATKVPFKIETTSADGLRPGTPVTISGLRAGEVTDVTLDTAEKVTVHFEVFDRFQEKIKADSVVLVIRPFIIGEKALDITIGSEAENIMPPGSLLQSQAGVDMMDLVSGKKLGPFIGTIEGLVTNLSTLAQAFSDPKRSKAFVDMFDKMNPLFSNLGVMAKEVTVLTKELNQVIPQIRKESPHVGKQISQLVNNLHGLIQVLQPAVKEVGPDLPRASRRALEALDEMVVTLKAIQKSFILSGKVEDVREEESRRERKPANK